MTSVLIQLHKGYGLGDAVQMSAVLRHVRKYRPDWIVDFMAEPGREEVGYGIAHNVCTYDVPIKSEVLYDRVIEIVLYDTFCAWPDRPNTRVTSCLHEKFGIPWNREVGGYEINITPNARQQAANFLGSITGHTVTFPIETSPAWRWKVKNKIVCVHYQGDSSPERKNLTHEQANAVCDAIIARGRIPLLLDWRGKWPLGDKPGVASVAGLPQRESWGKSAQMNTAIISQCEAFVGIDSGPGKCATASGTPSLICWTGHHPALFHDLSENTTHLVPEWHREMDLLQENQAVADYFEKNYHWRSYANAPDLVTQVKKWLGETLK